MKGTPASGAKRVENNAETTGGVTGKGFLPGRSGNAGGRPKRLSTLIGKIQRDTRDGEDLVDFMLRTFRSGPMRYRMEAAHWLTERGFGRAPQVVEHTGDKGDPISVRLIWPEEA